MNHAPPLGHKIVAEQCGKTCNVSARIDLRHEVFRSHSLDRTIPSMRVSSDKTSLDQTTKLGIKRVQDTDIHLCKTVVEA